MEQNWKKKLTKEQYQILREKGTETPFSGALLHNKTDGMYHCAGCSAALFSSKDKFDSGSGWPSFTDVVTSDAVALSNDTSHGMRRVEVSCKKCGGHLGHVFDDGPREAGGKRYCINSGALDFKKEN